MVRHIDLPFQLEIILSFKIEISKLSKGEDHWPGEVWAKGGINETISIGKPVQLPRWPFLTPTLLHRPNSFPSIKIQLKSCTSVKPSWIIEVQKFSLQTHSTNRISNQSGGQLVSFLHSLPNITIRLFLLVSSSPEAYRPPPKPLRSSVSWVPQGLVDYLAGVRPQVPHPTLSPQQLVGCRPGTVFCSWRHFPMLLMRKSVVVSMHIGGHRKIVGFGLDPREGRSTPKTRQASVLHKASP